MHFLNALKADPEIWKEGLRTGVAAILSFALAELLALPQGYWSVLTAIIIMQGTVGASLKAATDRWLGTLAGAVVGFVLESVTPSTTLGTLTGLALSSASLAMLAARYPSFRIAPLTAAILLISAPSHVDALISALHRVLEITLGCCVGVAVALFVTPSRAGESLRAEASRVLTLLAEFVTLETEYSNHEVDIEHLATMDEDIDAAYNTIDSLTKAVRAEHMSFLPHAGLDPERLGRCLRRLRIATLTLHHSAQFPQLMLDDTRTQSIRAVTEATHNYMLALSSSVSSNMPPPPMDQLEQAYAQAANAVAAAKQEQTTSAPLNWNDDKTQSGTDDRIATLISPFLSALKRMRAALRDLVDCINNLPEDGENPARQI